MGQERNFVEDALRASTFQRRQFLFGLGVSALGLLVGCGSGDGSPATPLATGSPSPQPSDSAEDEGSRENPIVSPSDRWNGNAGSGFQSLPNDPLRQTAKPVLRLLQPPNLFFTEDLLIGVIAAANDGGSLLTNLGLKKIVVHFEGNTVEIEQPTVKVVADATGALVSRLGWWVTLRRPKQGTTTGHGHLYFEAVPRDTTMQNRVIGPFQYSPQQQLHDWETTVGNVTGKHATVSSAIAAARASGAQNPRVTFVESGHHELSGSGPAYSVAGYLNFECRHGVAVTFSKPPDIGDANAFGRTRWDGMYFRGSGITFDFATMAAIFNEGQSTNPLGGRSHVFEDCKFTNSKGRYSLWRKGGRPSAWLVYGSPWFLECKFRSVLNPGQNANLFRGCAFSGGFFDAMNGASCVVNSTFYDWSSVEWRTPITALSIRYLQAAHSATISLSGHSGSPSRTLIAKVNGTEVGRLTVLTSEAAYRAGSQYSIGNVVYWINSLHGWSAQLHDDSRYAAYLTNGDPGFGAFEDNDALNEPLVLMTAADMHTDWYQTGTSQPHENVIIYGNRGWNLATQFIMIGAVSNRDYLIANNAWSGDPNDRENPDFAILRSQLSQYQSHMIFVHNSMPTQELFLRTGSASNQQLRCDRYCLVANNTLKNIAYADFEDMNVRIENNHLDAGNTGPSNAALTTSGGEFDTNYINALGGDFRPSGSVTQSLKYPALKYDLFGTVRADSSAPGAVA